MLKQALNEYAMSLEKVWGHDRTKTIGASEIGLCARRMHWTKTNRKPDEDQSANYGALLRGNVMESYFWVPAMQKKYGKNLKLCGKQQKTLQDKYLSATPDGLVINQPLNALASLGVKDLRSDCFVIECKSIDPRVNITEEKAEHQYQTQIQMGLIRRRTKWKPEYAVISYMDASFWHEITEFVIRFDQKVFDDAYHRAERTLTQKSHPPEGWIAGGKECEYCPFTKSCGIIRRSVPESEAAAEPQFVAEMTDLCREYRTYTDQQKEIEVKAREVQHKIKERLKEKGIRKIPKLVTWSPQKGRTSYDMVAIRDAAAAKGIDVETFSTVGDATDRLQVLI